MTRWRTSVTFSWSLAGTAALLLLLTSCSNDAAQKPSNDTASDKYAAADLVITGAIVTMDDERRIIERGTVVITDGVIEEVRTDDSLPGYAVGYPRIETSDYVFPGLINPHNHIAFNTLPRWDLSGLDQGPLDSVHDWRDEESALNDVRDSYSRSVLDPRDDLLSVRVVAEMGKWAELKELVAGTTVTQGSFGFENSGLNDPAAGFRNHLVRNVEFDLSGTRQSSSGIYAIGQSELDEALMSSVLSDAQSGELKAFLVHMSEGVNVAAVQELSDFNDFMRDPGSRCGPAMDLTSVIHGTAYGSEEFKLMADCGASLIASPLSNIMLYGQFPDLRTALRTGVNVALSTDWSATGSRNLLEELKVVDFLNSEFFDGVIGYDQMAAMVTTNAAKALGQGGSIGKIVPGTVGDLVVVAATYDDPYESLVAATEADIRLTVVGGDALYGEMALMSLLSPGDFDMIDSGCGFSKAVDVTAETDGLVLGDQDIAEIENRLTRAFRLSRILRGQDVATLFTCADAAHLDSIAGSNIVGSRHDRLVRLGRYLAESYR